MSQNNKIVKNFAVQASVLAIASVASKLIGFIYGIPLANIMKNEGSGYYGAAQTAYAFVLLIATFSIPAAISKIMAERIEKGEYRNVKKILNGATWYVFVVGLIASVFTYVMAPRFVTENSVFALRILAPTVFFSGFLSVYRGYFQAYGNMVPTSVSQIVEQVFNAVCSIIFTIVFMKWALQLGFGDDTTKYYAYGAAGGTVGTGIAVLAGLFYMFWLFRKEKPKLDQLIAKDQTEDVLSYGKVFKILLLVVTPIILSSAIYNANVIVDMTLFQKIMEFLGKGGDVIDGQYGMYSRIYLPLANVPIAMAAAVASAVIPSISTSYSAGDIGACNRKVTQSIQLTMVLTVPCAVGFAVLGKPITSMLYRHLSVSDNHMVSVFLLLGGSSIVLYGVSSVLNSVLQGMGKVNVPVISAGLALVLHVIFLIPMLLLTELGIYSLILATAFYAVIVVLFNYRVVKKEMHYKLDWKQTLFVPIASATIMGVITFLVYRGVFLLFNMFMKEYFSNAIASLFAIIVAIIIYFVSMIKIGGYTEEMLLTFPKGDALVRIARKLHLI